MTLFEKLQQKLGDLDSSLVFAAEAQQDMCVEGHDVLVIRERNTHMSGLVVVHEDDYFNETASAELIDLLTPQFLNGLDDRGVIGDDCDCYWAYTKIEEREGRRCIVVYNPMQIDILWDIEAGEFLNRDVA